MKWYESRENLRQLAQAIEDIHDDIQTSEFLEKPWKWDQEWNYYQKHNNLDGFEEYGDR